MQKDYHATPFIILQNGLYNAIPRLCKFVVGIGAGLVIDAVRAKEIMSTTNARKMAQTIGQSHWY